MKVKDAVTLAKTHVVELFADEDVRNVGLEEVELDIDHKQWLVTIGFSRPWDEPRNTLANLAGGANFPRRSFKMVKISDTSGEVLSVKNREV
ncbi:hypothetical protein [Abyssibacter profundi]|uniref:Uncharacterized protein n=1 Tax=Abyssibacter profundi TaxID=2182787 RepID=A0A363ULA4_9GAMM|nr:hypothetical protein [Abyssibacter profundi]PWN56198.1 hypothetical protein DEH80_07955 [Abyssibacter profundi]